MDRDVERASCDADFWGDVIARSGEDEPLIHGFRPSARERTGMPEYWWRRGCRVGENLPTFSLIYTPRLLIYECFLGIWIG